VTVKGRAPRGRPRMTWGGGGGLYLMILRAKELNREAATDQAAWRGAIR